MKNVSHTQLENKVKVVIPKDVLNKIQYLCTVISQVEWSGILFYTVKGTIKNPSKMSITLKDILPMDKGTTATTEFTYDERYVDYLMNDEKRTEWKSGLIHSHNNMAVFYSGTDQDELKKNSKSHNFYLSVVVNNKLDIIGRIGISAMAEATVKTSYKGLDEKGNPYTISPVNLTIKDEKLYYLDCEMIYTIPEINVEAEFLENVNTIVNEKKIVATKRKTSYIPPAYVETGYGNDFGSDWGNPNYGYQGMTYPRGKTVVPTTYPRTKTYTAPVDTIDKHLQRECEIFILKCFGVYDDDDILGETSLDDVFEDTEQLLLEEEVTIPEVIEDFATNFTNSYEAHFHLSIYGAEIILSTVENILDDYKDEYKFLKEIKNVLTKI